MRDVFGVQCTLGDRVAWPGHQGSATYLMKGEIIGWEDGGETVVIRCEPSGAITKKVHRWYPFAKASSK
jgi:hypothetical protein